jgi:hypothetical protein
MPKPRRRTTYKLDLPNATPVARSKSFKLLSGMMIAPTLSEANVRTDVPIVLAEMRERGGAAQRVHGCHAVRSAVCRAEAGRASGDRHRSHA